MNSQNSKKRYFSLILISINYFFILFFTSCNYYLPDPPCPPPPSAKCPLTKTFSCEGSTVPILIPYEDECLSLAALVDIAMQNSPTTRLAWFNAKIAATQLGTARGAYLPPIALQGQIKRTGTADVIDGEELTVYQTTAGPTISTDYLLLDFGGRSATIDAAKQALEALNWTYNWQVQTVMIDVLQSYYSLINARDLLKADESSGKDYERILEVTKELKVQGVKSLADELQSATDYYQAQIIIEHDKGVLHVAQITLSESLGIPLDSCYKVIDLPEHLDITPICDSIEKILCLAKTQRADLASLRSTVLENRANIRVARSQLWPTLSTQLSGSKTYINGKGPFNSFSAALTLNFNIFNSFSDINALRQAQAEWEASQAQLDAQELEAFLAVLTDYYEFLASTEVLKLSNDYLKTAEENKDVAFASYRAGVISIIDLLTAQNALSRARRQVANAKTNWLTSLANISYDTGGLMCTKVKDTRVKDENLTIIDCPNNCEGT